VFPNSELPKRSRQARLCLAILRNLFCNAAINAMIETNPIFAHIADLRGRLDALRRYL